MFFSQTTDLRYVIKYILIIVQRDATQSSLFIILLQVHSTCFGCQPHPSSGVHKTVTTASGTVQLPPSNVAGVNHTYQSGVHKTVTTASGTGHIFCAATSLQRGQAWPRWREVDAQYRRL